MFRSRFFWILFTIVAAGCALLAFRLFPQAFPLLSLDLAMDRPHAIASARQLAAAQHWGPADAVRDAASFGSDGYAQAFVELEGGGKTALADLFRDKFYAPYAWQVRLFKESEAHQTTVRFKPDGAPYGFDETLREDAPGAALDADTARVLAEQTAAAAPWQLPIARFTFVEKSQVLRPGGRVDHTFIYERPDRPLGEGRLRLQLVVSGDRLTGVSHFIKIPEAFSRRYEQMRSVNNVIASSAGIAMVLILLIGGCGVGLAYLLRRRAVLWRQPLAWAVVIAVLQLGAGLNAWPLVWLHYDTALSSGSFVAQQVLGVAVNALIQGLLAFVTFLVAEGLTRRAFPQQPQFWKLWSRDAAATPTVLGRTLGGYLLTGVMLLYVTGFYFFALRHFGWWTPSDAIVNPDALAHLWPSLTPFARATHAGFWEETLFRALPLASAALLGARFGGRRWWIVGAFVLQALIFAGAHANYPGQPAYSRLVELILPSCIFAALYLRFGLLPAILLHFGYDVVLMSLPLFAASAPGIFIDRAAIVLLSLVPLWIVLARRWQTGSWRTFPASLRNGSWQPAATRPATAEPARLVAPSTDVSTRLRLAVLGAGVLGLLAWFAFSPLQPVKSPLAISRTEAIAAATAELNRLGIVLPASIRADATVPSRPWEADRFAWQTASPADYAALLGNYLPNPYWSVRFARFDGDVADRAEEWSVAIAGDGRVLNVHHRLPEARAGASLTEAEARQRVHAVVREKWALDPAALEEISATSAKRPNRLDWTFVMKDPAVTSLEPGQARLRVVVSGDEVTEAWRFVFAPETWERADRAKQAYFRIGGAAKAIALAVLFIAGIILAILSWSRGVFSVRVALGTFAALGVVGVIQQANRWPAIRAGFSTAQPLQFQQTMAIVSPTLGVLIAAAAIGLIAGLVVRWLRPPIPQKGHAMSLGLGLAVATVGAFAAAALLRRSGAPAWPSFGAAGTFAPWIAGLSHSTAQFLTQTILLLLSFGLVERFTAHWQRRQLAGAALVFVVTALLSIPWGAANVGLWLILTAAGGAITTLGYLLVLRRDLTLMPLFVGVSGAFGELGNGLQQPYSGALSTAVISAVLCLALGWLGTRFLRQLATGRSTSAPENASVAPVPTSAV